MHPSASLPLLLSFSTAAHAFPVIDFLLHARAPTKSYSVVNVDGDPTTDAPPIVTVTKDPMQVTVTEHVSHTVTQEPSAVQTATTNFIPIVNVDGEAPTTVTVIQTEKPTPQPTSLAPTTPSPASPSTTVDLEPPMPSSDTPQSSSASPSVSQPAPPSSDASQPSSTSVVPWPSSASSPSSQVLQSSFRASAIPDPSSASSSRQSQAAPSATTSLQSSTLKTIIVETPSTPVSWRTSVTVVPPPWTETTITPTSVAASSVAEQAPSSVPVPPDNSITISSTSSTSTYSIWTSTSPGSAHIVTPNQVCETAFPTTWVQETTTAIHSTLLTSISDLTRSPSPIPTSSRSYDDGYWASNKYPDGSITPTAVPQ